MCIWDANKVMQYISGKHHTVTSHRSRRQAADGFNLNSLMSNMLDMRRRRISGVSRLMESMWNGTGSTSGNGNSMNALLMAGKFTRSLPFLYVDLTSLIRK